MKIGFTYSILQLILSNQITVIRISNYIGITQNLYTEWR